MEAFFETKVRKRDDAVSFKKHFKSSLINKIK